MLNPDPSFSKPTSDSNSADQTTDWWNEQFENQPKSPEQMGPPREFELEDEPEFPEENLRDRLRSFLRK